MKWFVLVLFIPLAQALPLELKNYLDSRWKLNDTEQKYLLAQKILTKADVSSFGDKQNFDMQAAAWHKRNCQRVIRKLSQFELYPDWISFIKKLSYNEQTNLLTMHADHPLLPFPMVVHVIVERPSKPGRYPFTFPTGIFRGLKGHFEISQFDKKCFFYAESKWFGDKSKIPDTVIEIFAETLARIGGDILMRKSH